MLIAVSQRSLTDTHSLSYDALELSWYDFLEACSLAPLLIPNHITQADYLINTIQVKGILLTGGNNQPLRDLLEKSLIEYGILHHLPIMGVCHGMQIIQSYFHVSLRPVSNHIATEQSIFIHGREKIVNSYHTIGTEETVPELEVWARAEDNVVKAIQHVSLPIIGIMWHPERKNPFSEEDIDLFKCFFREDL